MAGWALHEGRAVHLPLDNVDTDQLIPARFMSVPRSDGYGGYLLHDMRRKDGVLDPAFPLNGSTGASVLIAGRNFGSGSSREAAVYALVDAGFRVVLAPSFGDIFAANAVNNGLCPGVMTAQDIAQLVAARDGTFVVDLDAGHVSVGKLHLPFALDDTHATKLINGWDDIDLTLRHADEIAQFRAAHLAQDWRRPKANRQSGSRGNR